MKITKAGKSFDAEKEFKELNFSQVIGIYIHNKERDKTGVTFDPDLKTDELLLCCSRLNQIVANMLNMSYDDYLKMMKKTKEFVDKTSKLDLSDEQLKRMMDKDIKGFIEYLNSLQ